jgi:hypothetical protein
MDLRERWDRILGDRQDDRLTEFVLRARERIERDGLHPADRPAPTWPRCRNHPFLGVCRDCGRIGL